jgi:hypothetical protein
MKGEGPIVNRQSLIVNGGNGRLSSVFLPIRVWGTAVGHNHAKRSGGWERPLGSLTGENNSSRANKAARWGHQPQSGGQQRIGEMNELGRGL